MLEVHSKKYFIEEPQRIEPLFFCFFLFNSFHSMKLPLKNKLQKISAIVFTRWQSVCVLAQYTMDTLDRLVYFVSVY